MKIAVYKDKFKKNEKFYSFLKQSYYLFYRLKFNLFAALRGVGLFKGKYSDLKKIKDSYKGQECFIVATGPSLRYEDMDTLNKNNVICFSVNSIVAALDNTDWRPDFYGIQDTKSYEILIDKINKYSVDFKKIFIGSPITDIGLKVPKGSILYPLDQLDHLENNHSDYNAKFSPDPCVRVYDGYTIVFSMIQLAVYMGFKKIYLLGTDCNYVNPNSQFISYNRNDEGNLKAKEKMTVGYRAAREYIKNTDVKIYNATRGGMLEEFPRVDFDSLFKV